MYRIKISAGDKETAQGMLRQNPHGKNISACGKYEFIISEDIEEADFWMVRNKYIKQPETCIVAPENTVLLVSEPESVVYFPQKYTNQFGMLCTCQEHAKHKNILYTPAILPWFVGVGKKNGKIHYSLSYDQLKNCPAPQKTKLISVITSNKAFTKGHQDRIAFVEKLKAYYGDKLDVFGSGFNNFDDKWDVLAPYKYHIAIENSSSKYYWTEKISDCYLAGSFPIYYGCTNIKDYFPKEGFVQVDIHNFDETVKTIDRIIANNEFEKQHETLKYCKNLVLDDYNMFNLIASYCDSLDPNLPKQKVTLQPATSAFDWRNIYRQIIERNVLTIRKMVKFIFRGKSILKQ